MDDIIPDTAFSEVKLPSYFKWKASPKIPYEESGVMIAAPRKVLVSPKMQIPVCASAIIEDVEVPYRETVWDVIVGVAVDVQANRVYAGTLADPRMTPDPEHDQPRPQANESASPPARLSRGETIVRIYGNFDLRELLGIPPAPGTLYVHFTLGSHQSNVVRVDLVLDRGED